MKRAAAAIIAGGLLLAGCGKKDKPAEQPSSPPVAGLSATTVQCDTLPDFLPLYPDAAIVGCFKSASAVRANHESGSVIYTTKTGAAEILAWYKDQSAVKGLSPNMSTDSMFSARDGDKRTMMVMTGAPQNGGAGTQVTVNWGADEG